MTFFSYSITTLGQEEGLLGLFVLFLFISNYFCLPGFQEKRVSYYMFSVKNLLNSQFHANETEEQSSEKYFSSSIFMRKLSQLGRTFDCVMVVQQEAIGRLDPNHILNTENF